MAVQLQIVDDEVHSKLDIHQGNEAEIWKAFKDGDKEAFAYLFITYKDILYSYGLTVFSEQQLVNDCIQELFLALWLKRQNLAYVYSIKFYLIKSLRRMIINRIEEQKKIYSQPFIPHVGLDCVNSYEFDMIHEQKEKEQMDKLAHFIEKLPKRQKEVIYLRFYHKMSYEEITAVMSLSYKSARNHMCLAIQNLRKEVYAAKYTFISWLFSVIHLAMTFTIEEDAFLLLIS